MIGMLNCGGENTADFYASPRQSSLYKKRRVRSRSIVDYSSGGRVFIDGEPLDKSTPSEMWHEVLKKASVTNAIERSLLHIENEPTAISDSELETKKASKCRKDDISCMWQQIICDVRDSISKKQASIDESKNRKQSITSVVERRGSPS